MENAQKQVEKQAEDSEVARKAKVVAEEIIAKAEQTAQEMREGARIYADEILGALQDRLNKINQQIEQGRSELRAMK